MITSILPGQYAYALTRAQLFAIYLHRGLMRCILWTSALCAGCMCAVIFLFFKGALAFEQLVPLLVALALADAGSVAAVLWACRNKSRNPNPLPGGPVTLEWDSLSLCATSGQTVYVVPWRDLAWRRTLGGITVLLPEGHFLFIPKETTPEPVMCTFCAALTER